MLLHHLLQERAGISRKEFDQILRIFVPFAQNELQLDNLPKIVVKSVIKHGGQPTMGVFHNDESYKIEIATLNRHPVDVLRTLAHELVHAKQSTQRDSLDSTTGSDDENEANSMAGIIMRKFNKAHPEYLTSEAVIHGW